MAKSRRFIDDYGGNAYGGRRRNRRDGQHESFRCLSCDKLQYLTTRELSRASKPRCNNCGGCLEYSTAEKKRHKKSLAKVVVSKPRCPACRAAILGDTQENLERHFLFSPDCRAQLKQKELEIKDRIPLGSRDVAGVDPVILEVLPEPKNKPNPAKWTRAKPAVAGFFWAHAEYDGADAPPMVVETFVDGKYLMGRCRDRTFKISDASPRIWWTPVKCPPLRWQEPDFMMLAEADAELAGIKLQ